MEATNFIEEIINKDLESGKYDEIITRFPPEPNGYLHVGHAKALCVNFGIKQKYNGKCNLRFDDTNPTKEDTEYVEAIKEDIKWLGFTWDEELYASDYFEKMYDCAVILIKKGLAYVDNLTAEEIRLTRGTLTEGGKESPNRNRPIEESLDLFQRMRNGEFADGELVLRAKIDMNSPNINMRDPVIYRIVRAHHMRQKNKWCIYPMYDFAHPLEDAFEGITHSCCTLEFEDHRPLYDWVVDNCDIEKKPHQYEFARLNITRCIMSKRYLKSLVDNNKVDGWDDPRMPTICGLRRRGYTPESIKDFCERIGVAKANSELDIKNLEACIREDLNLRANRVMAVLRPIKLTLKNYEGVEELEVENNPSDETAGTRKITFSKDLYIDADDFALVPPPKWKRLSPGGMV
ncbi:MAG: glutamine--tRNA ligase, partial [Clostridia bacterium]|nr:glutamine--tRNA ligase [Clostridia bacterium]